MKMTLFLTATLLWPFLAVANEAGDLLESINRNLESIGYVVDKAGGLSRNEWQRSYWIEREGDTLRVVYRDRITYILEGEVADSYEENGVYAIDLGQLDHWATCQASQPGKLVIACADGATCIEQNYSRQFFNGDGSLRRAGNGSRALAKAAPLTGPKNLISQSVEELSLFLALESSQTGERCLSATWRPFHRPSS